MIQSAAFIEFLEFVSTNVTKLNSHDTIFSAKISFSYCLHQAHFIFFAKMKALRSTLEAIFDT